MKLQYGTINVEESGSYPSESFGFGDERVLFEILRGRMYSNPLYTVCQEVMSNAKDAHREVGKVDVPIIVKVPNKLDPTFWVEDQGPGICRDRMNNVCLRYGNSTKRDSNEQMGGYGLGFKSPFSYSPTFIVITTAEEIDTDGNAVRIKYIYVAKIDKTGKGQMTCQSSEITEETTGTRVIVTVKPDDFGRFISAVKVICQYWEHKPIINGCAEWGWPETEIVSQGRSWFLTKEHGSPKALVDGIPYPIDLEKVKTVTDHWNIANSLYSVPIRLVFNTGQLPITANREALDYYSGEAVANIRQILAYASKQLLKDLQREIDCCQTIKEALDVYSKMSSDGRRGFTQDLTWKSVKLSKYNKGITFTEHDGVKNVRAFSKNTNNKYGFSLSEDRYSRSYPNETYAWFPTNPKPNQKPVKVRTWNVSLNTSLLVENDARQNISRGRISALFDQYPAVRVIYVVSFGDKETDKETLLQNRKKACKHQLWNLFCPVLLSTVVPKKFLTVKQDRTLRIREFRGYHGYWSNVWHNVQVEIDKVPGIYIIYSDKVGYLKKVAKKRKKSKKGASDQPEPTTASRPEIDDVKININQLAAFAQDQKLKIYGVTLTDIPHLPDTWVSLNDHLEKMAREITKKVPYTLDDYGYCGSRKLHTRFWEVLVKIAPKLRATSLLRRYVEADELIHKNVKQLNTLEIIYQLGQRTVVKAIKASDGQTAMSPVKKMWQEMGVCYSMLVRLEINGRTTVAELTDEIADYVNWRDSLPQPKAAKKPKVAKKMTKKVAKKPSSGKIVIGVAPTVVPAPTAAMGVDASNKAEAL